MELIGTESSRWKHGLFRGEYATDIKISLKDLSKDELEKLHSVIKSYTHHFGVLGYHEHVITRSHAPVAVEMHTNSSLSLADYVITDHYKSFGLRNNVAIEEYRKSGLVNIFIEGNDAEDIKRIILEDHLDA